MTPQQQVAAADRRRVTQRRQDIDLLLSDLRARDLDVVFENGETPVLSDGKLTPPESLALLHRELARRVQELLAPVGLNCRSDAAKSPPAGKTACLNARGCVPGASPGSKAVKKGLGAAPLDESGCTN